MFVHDKRKEIFEVSDLPLWYSTCDSRVHMYELMHDMH